MSTKKVLIIDDDADLVMMYQEALQKAGYEVEVAYNAKEGLAKAQKAHPNVIMLDVMMETMSAGFDLARTLRANADTRAIPLALLTSVNATVPFTFEINENMPVDRFIEKPLRPEELAKHVSELLGT